jgi:hypothetical protein
MKNINKKSINLSLKILAILAFSLIFVPFTEAAAYTYSSIDNGFGTIDEGYSNPTNPKPTVNSINPGSSNVGVGTKTITITGSGFVPGSVARVNGSSRFTTFIDSSHLLVQINSNDIYTYSNNGGFYITVWNGAPGGGYSNSAFFTVKKVATSTPSTSSNTNSYTSPDTFTETVPAENENTDNANDSYSNLASGAIFGSNSFLPSGLIQWVLFAIVILIIVILARKIFGAKQNYEEAPMKHA